MKVFLERYPECRGPDGCFESREAILWAGSCGCWVFKCLLCGNVDHVRCHEDEDHWEEFKDEASYVVSGGWRG